MQGVLTRLYLVLLGVVVPLFLLAFAARYVHPRHAWWLQLLAVGLPFLSITVGLSLIPAVFLKGWKLVAMHGILLLLVIARFAPIGGGIHHRREPSDDDLRVMSFNADRKYDRSGLRNDLLRLFESERPDVVGLQEIAVLARGEVPTFYPGDPLTVLTDSLEYEMIRPAGAAGLQKTLPLLVRADPARLFRIQENGLQRRRDSAPFTYAHLKWRNRAIVVYNVHLRSFTEKPSLGQLGAWLRPSYLYDLFKSLRSDVLMRAQEAEYLKSVLNGQPLPFILTGDLNSTPHNWIYTHIRQGLKDAFGRSVGRGTYHSKRPLVRIDYIFASPGWEITSANVCRIEYSDHLPVSVSLHLTSHGAVGDTSIRSEQ